MQTKVNYGVPQIYFHSYADDTQLYLFMKGNTHQLVKLKECLKDKGYVYTNLDEFENSVFV